MFVLYIALYSIESVFMFMFAVDDEWWCIWLEQSSVCIPLPRPEEC